MTTDWFSWLSKTGLEPSLVYEYSLAFSQNELEEDDIGYFNHEFLQSMGISIAKHRLEILKLARKQKGRIPHHMSRLFITIKRTRRCFSKYFRSWILREDSSLALVPMRSYSSRRRNNAMVKRNKRLMVAKQSRGTPLLLTNGSPMLMQSSRIDSFSSPMNMMAHDPREDDRKHHQNYEEYWSSDVEEMRWDTMFHNLKPT